MGQQFAFAPPPAMAASTLQATATTTRPNTTNTVPVTPAIARQPSHPIGSTLVPTMTEGVTPSPTTVYGYHMSAAPTTTTPTTPAAAAHYSPYPVQYAQYAYAAGTPQQIGYFTSPYPYHHPGAVPLTMAVPPQASYASAGGAQQMPPTHGYVQVPAQYGGIYGAVPSCAAMYGNPNGQTPGQATMGPPSAYIWTEEPPAKRRKSGGEL